MHYLNMEEIDTFTGTVGIAAYSHALTTVSKLPYFIHSKSLDNVVEIACLEAWYINMRLICEFYGIGSRDSEKDFKAWHFAQTGISKEVKRELQVIWDISSKLVSHLSKDRNSEKYKVDVDYSLTNMIRLVNIVLSVSESFEKSLEAADSEFRNLIHFANVAARTELNFGNRP